jgi:hypothetical protein
LAGKQVEIGDEDKKKKLKKEAKVFRAQIVDGSVV